MLWDHFVKFDHGEPKIWQKKIIEQQEGRIQYNIHFNNLVGSKFNRKMHIKVELKILDLIMFKKMKINLE